jgi:predicted P-loop ATPase
MQGTKSGPYNNHENIGIALAHESSLLDGVYYDEFLDQILKRDGTQWLAHDDVRVAMYLQGNACLPKVTVGQVRAVIAQRLQATPRHCVREYLSRLTWDGQPRIHDAFCRYWNALPSKSQPPEYLRAVSGNFLISLVARIFAPGCQVDYMPVFEGAQGIRKSSALAVLGGRWFTVIHERVTEKDFFQSMQGVWLIEVSEMSAFPAAQMERVKSVITTRNDRFRGSYDPRPTNHPRQCVFAGTTNRDDWGHDETGLRRFWPVKVRGIELEELESVRDDLFAEAVWRYHRGEPWWEVPEVASTVQADRQDYDEWTPKILDWAQQQLALSQDYILIGNALSDGLRLPIQLINKGAQMRAANILRKANWKRSKVYVSTSKDELWVWFPPEERDDVGR